MDTLRVSVVTLGCKVNQCESSAIVERLNSLNIETSEGLQPADVYILNTCSVTAEADRKSRQYIGKMCKQNPDCHIIVVGCSSQYDPTRYSDPHIIAIGGTDNKLQYVEDLFRKNTLYCGYNTLSDIILCDNDNRRGRGGEIVRTREFIKIQDGCDRFCSYCIIPYLRGRIKSVPIDEIVGKCMGTRSSEIVLTGIDMSVYGKDLGVRLYELVRELRAVLARKRLGSLECEVIDDKLLSAMKESGFCPHFHLSLQSGADEVLKSMNRHYTTEYYLQKTELIRSYFPLAGITTDIIVGFPTETDDLFEKSLSFIEKCAFSDIHVFPYSKREGTLAAKKYDRLPGEVIRNRKNKLIALKKRLHEEFLQKNLGTVAEVYVEDREGGFNVGYTPNYIRVYSDAPNGSLVKERLVKPYRDGLKGEPI